MLPENRGLLVAATWDGEGSNGLAFAGQIHAGNLIGQGRVFDQANDFVAAAVERPPHEARITIMQYLGWYNRSRPHSKMREKKPGRMTNVCRDAVGG